VGGRVDVSGSGFSVQIFSLIHDGFIASECSDELLRDIEARVAERG